MRRDSIIDCVLEDYIILMFGDIWFSKNIDNKRKWKYYVSYYMWFVGCFFFFVWEIINLFFSMLDFLVLKYFDVFVFYVFKVCDGVDKEEFDEYDLDYLSMVLKIGFDFCCLVFVKFGNSIKFGEE